MSDAPTPELEKQLRELTTWNGPSPQLWQRALRAAAAGGAKTGRARRFMSRIPTWVFAGAAAAVVFVAIGLWMSVWGPSAGLPDGSRPGLDIMGRAGGKTMSRVQMGEYVSEDSDGDGVATAPPLEGRLQAPGHVGSERMTAGQPVHAPDGAAELLADTRQVIRKATIELAAEDVRAAFLKAGLLISEAQGEYVQDSSLSGSGNRMQANLTLRVAAARMPQVLNELRQLGEVRSESSGGEDVTAQVVDLEARLRNEQRVEAELLELLERREDAPLKEIIELRATISQVRERIEIATAQRERLSRLVALATILVIIRPADAPVPEPPGLWTQFTAAFSNAWHRGVVFLVRTLAGVLSVLIGGLFWWVILVAVILITRKYWRRAGREPEP